MPLIFLQLADHTSAQFQLSKMWSCGPGIKSGTGIVPHAANKYMAGHTFDCPEQSNSGLVSWWSGMLSNFKKKVYIYNFLLFWEWKTVPKLGLLFTYKYRFTNFTSMHTMDTAVFLWDFRAPINSHVPCLYAVCNWTSTSSPLTGFELSVHIPTWAGTTQRTWDDQSCWRGSCTPLSVAAAPCWCCSRTPPWSDVYACQQSTAQTHQQTFPLAAIILGAPAS